MCIRAILIPHNENLAPESVKKADRSFLLMYL